MPSSRTRRKKPVTGGLKGFTDARKSKIDLLKDIRTHVVAEGVKHNDQDREKHKIHVSEIVKDACPRMLFYKVSGESATDATAPAYHQLEIIWAAGTAEHVKWQRWLEEMGDLWGNWTCRVCETTYPDQFKPKRCNCGVVDLFRYDEVNLEVEDLALVGHADGAVPRLNTLVEIKTFSVGTVRVENPKLVAQHTHKVDGRSIIDHEALWAALKRPLKSHLIQGFFYLWMCREMGHPFDKIVFIYENKATQATKTYEVTLNDRVLKPFLDTLTSVLEAADTGDAPARPDLYTKEGNPCKVCPFRTKCWGENDDKDEASTSVSAGRPRSRSEASGGDSEVRPASSSREADSGRTRRHHRTGRPGSGSDDDGLYSVGRASRGTVGDGRGGRTVRRSSDGEVSSPRFARRNRQGRDKDQG